MPPAILSPALTCYLAKLRSGTLTEQVSTEFQFLMSYADNLESLADVIEADLVDFCRKAVALGSTRSENLVACIAERLTVDVDDYVELVRLEMSFVGKMRRIYTLTKRVCKDIFARRAGRARLKGSATQRDPRMLALAAPLQGRLG